VAKIRPADTIEKNPTLIFKFSPELYIKLIVVKISIYMEILNGNAVFGVRAMRRHVYCLLFTYTGPGVEKGQRCPAVKLNPAHKKNNWHVLSYH